MTDIRIVGTQGQSALVEWTDRGGGLHRAFIPKNKVEGSQCSEAVLAAGVVYGVEWEKAITLKATSKTLAQALRSRNIWTAQDAEARPNEVLGALQTAYGVDLSALLRAARKQEVR